MGSQMAQKRRKFPWLIVAIVLVLLAGGGWYAFQQFKPEEAPSYTTTAVRRGDIETSISAAGKVQPKESVDVGAQVSGQLESLLVEAGDIVEAGQLVAQIDATLAETSVEAQRAQLKELRASLRQQQATLKLRQSEAERARLLFEADAISRADFETAQANLTISESQIDSINASIERQSSSLTADLAELEFTKIYAPVSGTVVSLSASEGQTLNANQTAPTILTIADLTIMTVETDVSEADVLKVDVGQDAYFTTLGNTDQKWETSVRQILPTPEVVNDVVLYKALLDVDNPDGRLRTEMTTQVFFITGKAENALLVPITALQGARQRPNRPRPDGATGSQRPARPENAGEAPADRGPPPELRKIMQENPGATRDTVLIMGDDGEPRPQPVLVGLKTRTDAEILFGLKEGQMVVTGGGASAMPARPNGANGNRPPGPPGGFRRF